MLHVSANVQVGPDWAKAEEVAQGLWEILQLERGPKTGVTVPLVVENDPDGSKGKIHARAVDILRQKHPEVDVTVWNDGLFLTFKQSLDVMRSAPGGTFEKSHAVLAATEGEDLVMRARVAQAKPKRADPLDEVYERWPGALKGRDPRDIEDGEWIEWQEGARERAEERARRDKAWEEVKASATSAAPSDDRGVTVGMTVHDSEGTPILGAGAEPGAFGKFVNRVLKSIRG